MKKRSSLIFLILAVILTLPALFGIFHKGFFLSDDGNWMVIRFSAFFEALRNGQFPVRFLSRLNNGYGYPVADFLYPLFMYLGVPIHLLKFNFVDTIKIIFAASMILSSIFSFLWLRKIFDNLSSLVGSVVYSLFPYHLWDMYKRGSVGEILALAIVPFIFWQLERRSLVWASIGIALLIVAHNTIAILFIPVVVLYMALDIFITKDKIKLLYQNLTSVALGLLLSAFFWIPALWDLQYTVFSKIQVSDWSKYFSNFNLFGLSIFIVTLTFILILVRKIEIKKHRLTVLIFIVCILSLFLASSISSFLWKFLPVSFVQFPFRFLSVSVLCTAFLAACVTSVYTNKKKFVIGTLILVLTFVSAWNFLFPKNYQYYPNAYYSTNQDSTTVKNEYMPRWVDNLPGNYAAKAQILNGEERLNILSISPSSVSMQGYFSAKRIVQINTVYFPGWKVLLDGKSVPIDYNSNGLIRVSVPVGNHTIVSKFGETGIRIFADLLSIVGLITILFLFVYKKNKK